MSVDTMIEQVDKEMSPLEKEIAWRFFTLIEAGADAEGAERISLARNVDLHQATDMLKAGCSSELLVRILL